MNMLESMCWNLYEGLFISVIFNYHLSFNYVFRLEVIVDGN